MSIFSSFTSLIKVSALTLADKLTEEFDPFDEFTRPAKLKYIEPLFKKAQKFEDDLVSNFSLFSSTLWNYHRDAAKNPTEWGDQAIWHGITTAMWAIKYSVSKNPKDLAMLRFSLQGLELHQTVHGEPARRLIRGVKLDRTWIDDCSNDSACGHLAGIYFSWLYGDELVRQKCLVLVAGLADELLNNNFSLVGVSGQPTTYGALVQGTLTDPMRVSLAMAVMKTASVITGMSQYESAYTKLRNDYGVLCKFSKSRIIAGPITLSNWNDGHRAAIQLSILADLEVDPVWKTTYRDGLKRTWQQERKTGNPWIYFLCARAQKLQFSNADNCLKVLSEFTLEDKACTEKILSESDLAKLAIRLVKFKGEFIASQPVPKWMTGSQDFFWQRNPYTVTKYEGQKTPNTWYPGVDFLIAYWGLRNLGIIGADL